MPIRNMGTLIENIVVVSVLSTIADEGIRALASISYNSFAMPPLTKWRTHNADHGFSAAQLNAIEAASNP